VCLTATSVSDNTFTADVMVQTLSLTSLSALTVGSPVNLELAAQLNARMGGHIVQGHVDGVGSVSSIKPGEKWTEFSLTVPEHLLRYVVAQGSIALDGVSLTVGSVDDASCTVTVWLIPETLAKTNLASRQLGDLINIEVDILAKYVERMVAKGVTRGE
jgi:riboflavin synthase